MLHLEFLNLQGRMLWLRNGSCALYGFPESGRKKKKSFFSKLILKEWGRNSWRADLSFIVTRPPVINYRHTSSGRCVISFVISCFYISPRQGWLDHTVQLLDVIDINLLFLRAGRVFLFHPRPLTWESNIFHNRTVRAFYVGKTFFFQVQVSKFEIIQLSILLFEE